MSLTSIFDTKLINGVTLQAGRVFHADSSVPLIDEELSNKKYVDDEIVSNKVWLRDGPTTSLFPVNSGDKVVGGSASGGSLTIESTSDATKGPITLTGDKVNISNILAVDNITEFTNLAKITLDKISVHSAGIEVDIINSIGFGTGVRVDQVELNQGTVEATELITDSIVEKTGAAGVTIDSLLVKDGRALNDTSAAPSTDPELANKKYVDDEVVGINFWSRDAGFQNIFPKFEGDRINGSNIASGNMLLRATANAVQGNIILESVAQCNDDLLCDTVLEKTLNNGVNIDGSLVKDKQLIPDSATLTNFVDVSPEGDLRFGLADEIIRIGSDVQLRAGTGFSELQVNGTVRMRTSSATGTVSFRDDLNSDVFVFENTTKIIKSTAINKALPAGAFSNLAILDSDGTIGIAEVVFGSEFQEDSSDGLSTTMSTTFVQKLRMTTPSLPSGTYRISWSLEIKNDNTPLGGNFKVELDDTTILGEGFNDGSLADFTDQSGFVYQSAFSGVHNIDVDFLANGGTSEIRRVRLDIWRVA